MPVTVRRDFELARFATEESFALIDAVANDDTHKVILVSGVTAPRLLFLIAKRTGKRAQILVLGQILKMRFRVIRLIFAILYLIIPYPQSDRVNPRHPCRRTSKKVSFHQKPMRWPEKEPGSDRDALTEV